MRLLLPGATHHAAAEERLQALAELPKPADASLAVLLLAKGLWPEATSSPAYPQLARSLLDHASLSNGNRVLLTKGQSEQWQRAGKVMAEQSCLGNPCLGQRGADAISCQVC